MSNSAMEDTVRTSGEASSSSPFNTAPRTICHVCHKQFSQYTCPRCNSRYCSLQCYKSHSLRCTESFMRENVVQELQQVQSDDETKRKMLEILKRVHEEEEGDGMDEDGSGLSEETIQKILSGDRISIHDLSAVEKKRFQRAMASGELSKMIEPWEPWWLKPSVRKIHLSQEGTQLVQPLTGKEAPGSPENISERNSDGIPPGPENPLPPLCKISSTEPSPLLAVHLIDIIYTYCFTLRFYNGDWQSDALDSAMTLLSVSWVLGHGGRPESVLEAISHCLEQTCSPAYRHVGGLRLGMALVDDVISILSLGTPALIALLNDLRRLIEAGERELKQERSRVLRKSEIKTKLKLAGRKVYFMMCWVHEQPQEAWLSLAAIVTAEKGVSQVHGVGDRNTKIDNRSGSEGKSLIEEIQ